MCDLSVIVPVHNADKTVGRCARSCLSQFGVDIELVVVDDGSVDSTSDVLDSLANQYSQIRIISVQNGGVSRARNIGIRAALGNYIAFCDADDWFDEDVLGRVLYHIRITNSAIAVFGYRNVRNTSITAHTFRYRRVVGANEFATAVLLDSRVAGFMWNKIYRKDVLVGVRLDESLSVCEDMDLNLRIALNYPEMRVCYVPGALYNYDIRGSESLTRGCDSCEAVRNVVKKYLKIPELSKSAEAALYSAAVKQIVARSAGSAVNDLAYRKSYWLNRRCPVVEKIKCLVRIAMNYYSIK